MSTSGRFLSRWSRLKLAPVEAAPETPVAATVQPATGAAVEGASPASDDQMVAPAALPDIASLALDSDFTAFLKDEVSEGLRRQALKKLFNDPHFNVMDGLDIYIDDYSVSTPIPPELMAKLRSAAEWLADTDAKDDVAVSAKSKPLDMAEATAESSPAPADEGGAPEVAASVDVAVPPEAGQSDTVPAGR